MALPFERGDGAHGACGAGRGLAFAPVGLPARVVCALALLPGLRVGLRGPGLGGSHRRPARRAAPQDPHERERGEEQGQDERRDERDARPLVVEGLGPDHGQGRPGEQGDGEGDGEGEGDAGSGHWLRPTRAPHPGTGPFVREPSSTLSGSMDECALAERLMSYDTSRPEQIRSASSFVGGWLESRDIDVGDRSSTTDSRS